MRNIQHNKAQSSLVNSVKKTVNFPNQRYRFLKKKRKIIFLVLFIIFKFSVEMVLSILDKNNSSFRGQLMLRIFISFLVYLSVSKSKTLNLQLKVNYS